MNFTELSTGIKNRLEGLVVVSHGAPHTVEVRIGFPEPEYVQRDYPTISAQLVNYVPAPVREDIVPETYGRVGVNAYLKHLPDAYDFTWQVDCFSRFHSHLDQMAEHVHTQLGSRIRSGYVELATASLSSDVSSGDKTIRLIDATGYNPGEFIVLDRATSIRKLSGTTLQAFRILDISSDNVLTTEEEASFDFLASETAAYKARFETIYNNTFSDAEQDGQGHHYYRRMINFTVWGNLDLDTPEIVKVVTQDPVVTEALDYSDVTYGSEGYRKYKE